MRRGRGLAALTLVAISAVVAMCVYPTEHDADVFVTIDSLTLDPLSRTPTSVGPLVVIQGAEGDVHATAWHRQSGGPSAPVLNVSFRWSVADTTLARIDATTGHLVAIKAGITQVRVVATNFDAGAAPATLDIRVSAPLAIDSIRPDTVRYGEIATVYGVGLLDTIGVVLSIGDATLIPVPFTDTLKANGSSQISFWVPPPAHTAPLSYIAFGAGVFGSTPDSVAVIRRDIFEPNEIAPALIDLEARPFPGTVLAPLLFLNPALAFEPLPRDVLQGADWYRLRQLTQRDLTIVLSSTVPGTFQTFLTDQLTFQASDTSYHIGPDSWTFGPQSHSCHGAAFGPKEAPAESTVVALHDFPAGSLDAIAVYNQPGRYALVVYEGYGTNGKGVVREDSAPPRPGRRAVLPGRDGLRRRAHALFSLLRFRQLRAPARTPGALPGRAPGERHAPRSSRGGDPARRPPCCAAPSGQDAPMTSPVVECFRCHTPIPENSRFCSSCGADVSGGDGPTSTSSIDIVRERLQRIIEGEYRIERLLGKGGMGQVFLAHDLTLEREVAIKVLPPDVAQDDQVVRRFQQEAKTAAKLDHPNIIPIYRVESEGGLNYFVMKYISGTSLEDLLDKKEPLPVPEIQRILWEAACALGHAHQRGVVHRDVKPANIMFDHDGRVMLTDFGISKALQAATGFTATGMIIGTPHYMAPEQGKGSAVDGRADQYSLGVVGYRMITAELPFSGDSVHTIIYKHIYEEPPLASTKRPGIPGALTVAISRALAKEPDQRFPTMEDFATAVWPEQPVASPAKSRSAARPRARATADAPTEITGAPTTPLPAAKSRRPAPPTARRRSRLPAVIGVAVVVAGVVGYLAQKGSREPAAVPAPGSQLPAPRVDTVRVPAQPRAKPRQAAPAVEAQGFLTIAADPFGQVYIDGVDAGQTPLVEYAVKPGRHTIRIEHAGFKTITATVPGAARTTAP